MDLEIAILSAKGGDSVGLMKAMTDQGGTEGLLSCPGCNKVTLLQGV